MVDSIDDAAKSWWNSSVTELSTSPAWRVFAASGTASVENAVVSTTS